MALPRITHPKYYTKLISNDKEVEYRPFTVGEEKILLMASESKNTADYTKAVLQVVKNCVTSIDVDVEMLPVFDINYLFTRVRAASIGENVDTVFVCQRIKPDDTLCNKELKVSLSIEDVKIEKPKVEPTIMLTATLGVKMRYPAFKNLTIIKDEDSELVRTTKILFLSTEMIFEGDEVHTPKDFTLTEFEKFIEGLNQQQYKKLTDFVESMPFFFLEKEYNCQGECEYCQDTKHVHKFRVEDPTDFFTL